MVIFPFLLLILEVSSSEVGQDESDFDNWYFETYEGMENRPKCYVRRSWTHIQVGYSMKCVECPNQHYIIISFGDESLGAMKTVRCGNVQWTVTILPPDTSGTEAVHGVQVDLTGRTCVKLSYKRDEDGQTFVPQESPCSKADHWKSRILLGWKNGWKEMKAPAGRGSVKEVVKRTANNNEECRSLHTWKYVDNNISMKCLDCPEDYIAVIYNENIEMAAASVETCHSADMERSITLVQIKSKEVYTVQYQLTSEQCEMHTYAKREHEFGEELKASCLYKPRWYMAVLRGYQNGWKIQKKQKEKKGNSSSKGKLFQNA